MAAASGIVVRNTFIDVCPMEEESNSDESSPCKSPNRRNASAPPSPTRQRNNASGKGDEQEDFSDEEEEEEPGAIPNYQWNDSGLVTAEGAAEVLQNLERQPPWLKAPPGSPKKVLSKKSSKIHSQDAPGYQGQPRPALGTFLRGGVSPLLDPGYIGGGGLGGLGPELGSGHAPADHIGMARGHAEFPAGGLGGLSDPLGSLSRGGLGLEPAFSLGALGSGAPGRGFAGLGGFELDGREDGREARQSQEDLARTHEALGSGAAYLSESPPPAPALGGISTEAPVYILGAGSACSSSNTSSQQLPEASRRRGDAAQRTAPGEVIGKRGWPHGHHYYDGQPGMSPPAFHMPPHNSHSVPVSYPDPLMPPPRSYVPSGDAGDRRPDGFVDPVAMAAVGGYDPYSRYSGAAGSFASDRDRAGFYGSLHGPPGPRGGDLPVDDRAVRGSKGGRGGKGKGVRGDGGADAYDDRDRGTPWVAPGSNTAGLWVAPGAITNAMGKGGKGKDDDGKGEAKANKVPLSGGGPKRTDYLKKYGTGGSGGPGAHHEEYGVGPVPQAGGGGGGASGTSGKTPITTMMLKNIPCRKSQEEVMAHIDSKGFGTRYDFFYLPRDVKFRANLGYAFINFATPEDASGFKDEMDGFQFTGSGSSKACAVVPAHVQGLMNNLSAFKRTEVMRSSRKPYFSGVVTL